MGDAFKIKRRDDIGGVEVSGRWKVVLTDGILRPLGRDVNQAACAMAIREIVAKSEAQAVALEIEQALLKAMRGGEA